MRSQTLFTSQPAAQTIPVAVGNTASQNVALTYFSEPPHNAVSTSQAKVVLIHLDHPNYSLAKPVYISLKEEAVDEYTACFEEASLSRSGITPKEAVDWLKSSIVSVYESLKNREARRLGPLPARQLKVLGEYLGKKPNSKA